MFDIIKLIKELFRSPDKAREFIVTSLSKTSALTGLELRRKLEKEEFNISPGRFYVLMSRLQDEGVVKAFKRNELLRWNNQTREVARRYYYLNRETSESAK